MKANIFVSLKRDDMTTIDFQHELEKEDSTERPGYLIVENQLMDLNFDGRIGNSAQHNPSILYTGYTPAYKTDSSDQPEFYHTTFICSYKEKFYTINSNCYSKKHKRHAAFVTAIAHSLSFISDEPLPLSKEDHYELQEFGKRIFLAIVNNDTVEFGSFLTKQKDLIRTIEDNFRDNVLKERFLKIASSHWNEMHSTFNDEALNSFKGLWQSATENGIDLKNANFMKFEITPRKELPDIKCVEATLSLSINNNMYDVPIRNISLLNGSWSVVQFKPYEIRR